MHMGYRMPWNQQYRKQPLGCTGEATNHLLDTRHLHDHVQLTLHTLPHLHDLVSVALHTLPHLHDLVQRVHERPLF